jgi:diphthine synthase
MVFFLIGLGLCSEHDITVRGLEIVRRCHAVYLEHYTAILMTGPERLVCSPAGQKKNGKRRKKVM